MPHVPTAMPAGLLTYEQAAQELGITLDSMRTAVTRGRIRAVKIPGYRTKFLRQQDVEIYRSDRRVEYPEQQRQETPLAAAAPPAPVAQMSPEQLQAYMQALAAPLQSLAKATAEATMREAVPGAIVSMLGGLQILRGQQPTLDPKALAV